MKHLLLFFFAALFAGAGSVLLYENRHGPSMAVLLFAGGCYFVALFLAAPANAKDAIAAIAPYLPFGKSSSNPS